MNNILERSDICELKKGCFSAARRLVPALARAALSLHDGINSATRTSSVKDAFFSHWVWPNDGDHLSFEHQ